MSSPPVVEIKPKKAKKLIVRLGVAEEASSKIDPVTEIAPRGIKAIYIRLNEIEQALEKIDTPPPSLLACKIGSGGNAKCSNCLFCRGHSSTYNYQIGTCFGGDVPKIVRLSGGCRNHRFGRFSVYKIRGPKHWVDKYVR